MRFRERMGPALSLVLVVSSVSCRPELIVRLATRVYHDGSLERRVDLIGHDGEGKPLTDDDWVEKKVGVQLASPEAWDRVERGPGWLRADGFFLSADDLPPVLAVDTGPAMREARLRTFVTVENRIVLKRWSYVERHGDPFSAADSATALDALVELAVRALDSELHDQFGSRVDPAPAERFLRNEGRDLVESLLAVNRGAPGWSQAEDRAIQWSGVLTRYGTPVLAEPDPDDYWDEEVPLLLEWARERVAAELSTPDAPIAPEELSFWPIGEDYEALASDIVARVWGSDEELYEEAEPHLAALAGYYGGDDVPRFRYESRVSLPGVLLKTNGTPDEDAVLTLIRERDLTFGDVSLRAESVELQTEALVSLGARRDLDGMELLRLADLLWNRDPDGGMVPLLERAVSESSLARLRDEDSVPDELLLVARELADLLDPGVPPD